MTEFIGKFLCTVTIVMITSFEFITEKLAISRYMEDIWREIEKELSVI